MARRPSMLPSDIGDLTPHGLGAGDRRKSLFPILANHRKSSVGGLGTLLAAKRFGKKKGEKREGSPNPVQVNYEPTYRMEPKMKMTVGNVHKVLKEVLEERLDGFQYNPKFCVTMTQVLTDEIKERLKQMGWERYKIVAHVVLGERRDQDVVVTSRCAWDPRVDNFASYSFTSKTLFCTASAYGLYAE